MLKICRMFKENLLKGPQDINPEEIFEFPTAEEKEVDSNNDMIIKMEQMTLDVLLPDLEEGESLLLKLAEKQMTVLPNFPGVFKRICRNGEGRMPPLDSLVTVHYNAYLEDEISNQVKPFDSTVLRGKPFSFM